MTYSFDNCQSNGIIIQTIFTIKVKEDHFIFSLLEYDYPEENGIEVYLGETETFFGETICKGDVYYLNALRLLKDEILDNNESYINILKALKGVDKFNL